MSSSPVLHPYAERVRDIVRAFLANKADLHTSAGLLAALWDKASREYPLDSDIGRSFAAMTFVGFVTYPMYLGPSAPESLEEGKKVASLTSEAYERFLAIERGRLTSA